MTINLSATGLVILAAGASTRMGTPKQLLPYQGRSFLSHVVEAAVASICRPIAVVLGAYASRLKPELSQFPVQVVENPYWTEGMSSSIRAGIKAISTTPKKMDAVVLVLCDQPFISSQIINQLVETYYSTGKPVVASEYVGTLGVPALFNHTFFSKLTTLKGGEGAKQIMMKYLHDVFRVPFPLGAVDVDTPEDYEQFLLMSRGEFIF